jgi:Rieske Fe-S protein
MSDPTRSADEDAPHRLRPVPVPVDRRGFLVWAAAASLGASLVFIGATVIQAMVPPSRSVDGKKNAGRLVVARMSDLKVNEPRRTDYGEDTVYVVKTSNTEALVFDAACPHMGCELSFNEQSNEFDCPCHQSVFTIGGVRLKGPAPRNMISAVSEVVDGEVVVSGFRA